MRFPRFWSLGRFGPGFAWGWSDVSQAEADALAARRAEQVADALRAGKLWGRAGEYYPERPIREAVLRELGPADAPAAILSRNAYGAEVLNAARALFVDVDLPPARRPGLLARLIGARLPQPGQPAPAEAAALAAAEDWARAHAGWSWRVYRTAAGLRLLATHGVFDPSDPVVAAVFAALKADPLYRKLCAAQGCFRARLTPKPWRIGIRKEPPRWPWTAPGAEQAFARWDAAYRAASAGFATCELARVIGSHEIHSALREIVALHDAACGVGSGRPLA